MNKVRRSRSSYATASVLSEEHPVPDVPKAFSSVDELLEAGLVMLRIRRSYHDAVTEVPADPKRCAVFKKDAKNRTTHWHRSFNLSKDKLPLVKYIATVRTNRIEREIILVLLLERLALIEMYETNCRKALAPLRLTPMEQLKAMRSLTESGRLIQHGLISVNEESSESPSGWELFLDPVIVAMVMNPTESASSGWPVKTEEALYDYLRRLATAFQKKAEYMQEVHRGSYGSCKSEVYKFKRTIEHLLNGLALTLKYHPEWHLSAIMKEMDEDEYKFSKVEWIIFLVLLCKELGHVSSDDDLFQGLGLLRACCPEHTLQYRAHQNLTAAATLRAEDWIQPCGGSDAFITDDPQDIEESEFELTKYSLEKLGLHRKLSRKRKSGYELQQPKVKMKDLVFDEATQTCLKQALAQSRYATVLFHDWGLAEQITYGQGVTLMFYGPPGTGKTAGAQALAHELQKPIMVADYSRLQNCFVGQTEKNIVRIFREAAEKDAVLFWDEADAMFFDRDSASQSWEVRDTNVLLQELERFRGTCILATNRVFVLDKALERRISLKVKFDRPDRNSRREIFRRMLPGKLPLGADVDIDVLADYDLSGGEIKNVILNAARNALVRKGPEATVMLEDFRAAIKTMKRNSWAQKSGRIIGFTA